MTEQGGRLIKVARDNRPSYYRSGLYRRIDSWTKLISNRNPLIYMRETLNEKASEFRAKPFIPLPLPSPLCAPPLFSSSLPPPPLLCLLLRCSISRCQPGCLARPATDTPARPLPQASQPLLRPYQPGCRPAALAGRSTPTSAVTVNRRLTPGAQVRGVQ